MYSVILKEQYLHTFLAGSGCLPPRPPVELCGCANSTQRKGIFPAVKNYKGRASRHYKCHSLNIRELDSMNYILSFN